MGGGRSSNRYPFTASQWQELEHQALIFKYMMSGLPVPPELILPIRRSLLFMDPTALPFVHHPSPIGWGVHQLGYARKAEDPEPGRCRRTDGKKWRCSKEAFPESKYCERHMHRGKSRSRKLVELTLATTNSTSAHEYLSKDLPPDLSLSSSRFPPAVFSHPDNPASFSSPLIPQSVYTYRNFLGFRKDINELPFLSESTGRETPCSRPKESFDRKQVTGSDLRSGVPQRTEVVDLERDEGRQKLRPFHWFFDEVPQRSKASWMSSGEDRAQQDSFSKTQLSISIPAANREVPVRASQFYNSPNVTT